MTQPPEAPPPPMQAPDAPEAPDAQDDRSDRYTDANGFIDVRKLMAAFTFEEHVRRADDYFKVMADPWIHILRKPFHEPQDTRANLAGFAAVLEMAKIRTGQRVVDFGCGAGWLSQALSLMRCIPVGLDVSEEVLKVARAAVDEHPLLRSQDITFLAIGETTIPLDDESVDRIICFDSFHHVTNQQAYLREFHRILRPGGLAAFHEPGPRHSTSEMSQSEMRNFAVVENDIVIEDIARMAEEIGFKDLRLAAFTESPVMLDMTAFLRGVGRRGGFRFYHGLGRTLMAQSCEKRVFVIRKAGETDGDSRFRDRLGAALTVDSHSFDQATRRLTARLTVRNTGTGYWLASGVAAGAVNLSARIILADGKREADAARFPVAAAATPSGQARMVEVSLEIPYAAGDDFAVEFDLVSELVAWFSDLGMPPLALRVTV